MVVDPDELERAREAAPAMLALLKAINRAQTPSAEFFEDMVRSLVMDLLFYMEQPKGPPN